MDPLPLPVCRQLGAEKVIAVDINNPNVDEHVKGFGEMNVFSVIDETLRVVMKVAQRHEGLDDDAELTLAPSVRDIKLLDFHKAEQLVTLGCEYAMSRWDILHDFAETPSTRWL